MDLTPRLLHDVEFSQEWRGYNREEVDDFLERVAASVEQLLERLRDTPGGSPAPAVAPVPAPAAVAEPAAAPTAAPSATNGSAHVPDTESITRTLVLAQRTADAAIAEAKEQAAAMVAEAEQRAAAIVAAAETDARRILDTGRADAAAEVTRLEETRGLLQADVEALEQHLADQRHAVEDVVGRLQAMLDDPESLRAGERPELHVTEPVEPPSVAQVAEASAPVAEEAPAAPAAEEPAIDATAGGDDDDRGGPPTMEVATVFVDDEPPIDLSQDRLAGSSENDAFLTELRKARDDDAPLGPRDDDMMPAMHGIFDQDDLDSREGLRSRLRRRQ